MTQGRAGSEVAEVFLRAAWVPLMVGLLAGCALGIVFAAPWDFEPSSLAFMMGAVGVVGMVIGGVAGVAMTVSAGCIPGRAGPLTAGAAAAMLIVGLAVAALTWGSPRYVWSAVVMAAVAALAHGAVAQRWGRTSARDAAAGRARPSAGGVLAFVVGCAIAPMLASTPDAFTCTMLVGGEAGDGVWMCPDGSAMLGLLISSIGPAALVGAAGVGVAVTARSRGVRIAGYLSVAMAVLVAAAVWSRQEAPEREYPSGDAFIWSESALPPLLLMAAVLLALAVGRVLRPPGGAVARVAAAVLLVAAFVVQGALAPVMVVVGGFAVAAGVEGRTGGG